MELVGVRDIEGNSSTVSGEQTRHARQFQISGSKRIEVFS